MVSPLPAPIAPLFVPGDRPERFGRAAASGTDAVILDLEDAVAPENKAAARIAVAARGPLAAPVIVRVHAAESGRLDDDLAALAADPPETIMLAKAEAADELARIRTALGDGVRLVPLIESARGLVALGEMLSVDGVVTAAFGSLDFALDLGCDPDWEPLLAARSEIVLRCRLAGRAPPIDGVTLVLDDDAPVEREARRARALGFGGKLAIHPRQVAPIRAAFRPSAEDVAWAERVFAALDGAGAQRIDGKMIDRPVIERARRIRAATG